MKTIHATAVACILALGIAGAATVAPAAMRLRAANDPAPAVAHAVQAIATDLPTVIIIGKRLNAPQKAARAG